MRFLSPIVVAAVVIVGASGCGLSDYQRTMDEQRKRVTEFDEGNRLLDDPIDAPRIQFGEGAEQKSWPAWGYDIYLRLPKGYGTAPKEKTPFNYPFPCYHYVGGSEGANGLFIAAAWIADPKAKEDWGKYTRANFRTLVRKALEDYYAKTYKIPYAFPFSDKVEPKTREVKVVTPYPDGTASGKIPYLWMAYSDEGNKLIKDYSVFEVFIREEGSKQFAFAFQRPLRPPNAIGLNQSIEACLGTLDISSSTNVDAKRYQFKKAKGL